MKYQLILEFLKKICLICGLFLLVACQVDKKNLQKAIDIKIYRTFDPNNLKVVFKNLRKEKIDEFVFGIQPTGQEEVDYVRYENIDKFQKKVFVMELNPKLKVNLTNSVILTIIVKYKNLAMLHEFRTVSISDLPVRY